MKHSTRTLISVAAAAAAVAGTATAAYSATAGFPHFGHTTVRTNIPVGTAHFKVTSDELKSGRFPAADYAASFGCTGTNHAPTLHWSGAPAGTKSFAVTMFDKDAPTGSGFWHWQNWDVPAGTAAFEGTFPAGSVAGTNDSGGTGYLGPCPPAGDIAHHYVITVLALDVPSLGLAPTTPAAFASFAEGGHVIGSAQLTAVAQR